MAWRDDYVQDEPEGSPGDYHTPPDFRPGWMVEVDYTRPDADGNPYRAWTRKHADLWDRLHGFAEPPIETVDEYLDRVGELPEAATLQDAEDRLAGVAGG